MKKPLTDHLFDYLLLKVQATAAKGLAGRKGQHLKSITISRCLIGEADAVGPLVFEVESNYLGEIWIAQARYFSTDKKTDSYTYHHEDESSFPQLEIDMRQRKKGKRSLVKVRRENGEVEAKLMFALD